MTHTTTGELTAAADALDDDSVTHGVPRHIADPLAAWLRATAREFESLSNPPLDNHPLDGRRTAGLAVARSINGGPR